MFFFCILACIHVISTVDVTGEIFGDILHVDEPLHAFTLGSCSRQNWPQLLWNVLADRIPESSFFLWMGDIVYNDHRIVINRFRPNSIERMRATYASQRRRPEYKAYLDRVDFVTGVYDDHDYGLNNAGSDYKDKEKSQRLLLEFLDEPKSSARHHRASAFGSLTFGPTGNRTLLIILDTRFYRDQPDRSVHSTADILGSEQWRWLESLLAGHSHQFRRIFIVSSIQVLSDTAYIERWDNFPSSKRRLFSLLSQTSPPVLFLSGDIHQSEFLCSEANGRAYYELTTSGMTHTIAMWSSWLPWLMRHAARKTNRLGDIDTQMNAAGIRIFNEQIEMKVFNANGDAVKDIHLDLSPESSYSKRCPKQDYPVPFDARDFYIGLLEIGLFSIFAWVLIWKLCCCSCSARPRDRVEKIKSQ